MYYRDPFLKIKSRILSGAFRVTQFSLYLQNQGDSRHETLQFFQLFAFHNIWKDQPCGIGGSEFYEWLFEPEKFSGQRSVL